MKKRHEFEFPWGYLIYNYAAYLPYLDGPVCDVCGFALSSIAHRYVMVAVYLKPSVAQRVRGGIIFARHKLCYCTYCDVLAASLNNLKKYKSNLELSNHEVLVIWKDIKPLLIKITKYRTTKSR